MRAWTWAVEGVMGVKADHAVIRCDGAYKGVWSIDADPQMLVDALNEREQRDALAEHLPEIIDEARTAHAKFWPEDRRTDAYTINLTGHQLHDG